MKLVEATPKFFNKILMNTPGRCYEVSFQSFNWNKYFSQKMPEISYSFLQLGAQKYIHSIITLS